MSRRLLIAGCCLVLLVASAMSAAARVITDMAGRKVTIPDKITRIYTPQLYTNVLLYMVAPEKMVNVLQAPPLPFRTQDTHFLRKEVRNNPMLRGGIRVGGSAPLNMEAVLALKPQIALATGGSNMMLNAQRMQQQYDRLHLPLVIVNVDEVSGYPAAIDFLGKLLGCEARTRQLSAWARSSLGGVQRMLTKMPPSKRVRVYYAESEDGLATESDASFHVDGLRLGGANIVHHGDLKTHYGMEKVSLEQILLYNPQVIFTALPEFVAYAYKDPRWQKVEAIAKHRIYLIPRSPYDWLDRPPSVTRIIGIPWVAYKLYPKQYPGDIRQQIRDFHRLFMGVNVTDAELHEWLK